MLEKSVTTKQFPNLLFRKKLKMIFFKLRCQNTIITTCIPEQKKYDYVLCLINF